MLFRAGLIILTLAPCSRAGETAQADLFPFVVSFDAPQNAANVSAWLPRPAGRQGFVAVSDGRLVIGPDRQPIRFWATNFCFSACFPSHEQAERAAARLARLGINCVRLHHMDSRDIWGKSPNKTVIDPEQLEKLDYLIHQFKRHGVYVNINLHVSRWLDEKEGFPARAQRPNYDKGLDNFEPRMIELQKQYARDLLTHVNPYTKTAYADEPAVAFVEINNENALFSEWSGGSIDRLPEPYAATFRRLWNAWLKKKYGTTEKLRQAWSAGEQPLGEELLRNGDFAQPLAGVWQLESDDQAKAELAAEDGGPQGARKLRLTVRQAGRVAWRPQLTHAKFAVKKGGLYTLSFAVRADQKRSIAVSCMMHHEPWAGLGLRANIEAGPDWRRVRRTFLAERDDDGARIAFSGFVPGTYELAAVSLRPGGALGLAKEERLEDDSVAPLRRTDLSSTPAAIADMIQFLWDTERDYWHGMYRFLKDELKVRSLVSGTQLGYSPVYVQAGLDYIDNHSYWHHPNFPGRPWDPQNWTVKNEALVNNLPGTLGGLAGRRVAGMAYTVSEYNHPAPNAYAAEGFPMIAAVGAFQRWDGIFSFCYSHSQDFEPRRITGFFDIKGDTSRLVHSPCCAAMFLRGDVAPARETLQVPLSPAAEMQSLREANSARRLSTSDLGLAAHSAVAHGVALAIGRSLPAATPPAPAAAPTAPAEVVSDTGELRWNVAEKGAGYFTVNAPRSKLFTGFVRGRQFDLGGVQLQIGQTRLDWATVSLVCLDGVGFDRPGRILLAATGDVQNRGAQLQQLPDGKVTLGNRWGEEPLLCEGVLAEVVLPVAPARVKFYPLDESGNRRAAAAAGERAGRALLTLGPQHKTVWYEIEIQP
jgi:hypothetical protein